MKGVSAVIATILMLIITIALAGMAYMYISGIFTGTTQGIELVDSYCSAGVANIKIRNAGSTDIGVGAIEVARSSPAGSVACTDATMQTQAVCETNQCCEWTLVPDCDVKTSPPTGCLTDGSTPVDCCTSAIPPGAAEWFVDSTCGSAKSCVYRISPPAGKTQTPIITCT